MAVMLPPLVQQIILDPSGLHAGAAKAQTAMKGMAASTTAASTAAVGMSTSLNTLAFRAQTAGRILLKNVAGPLMIIAGLSIKAFATFEASMTRITSLVGVSAGAVRGFSDEVKGIAEATGRGPAELAEAMFFITSAGLRGSIAVDTLNASAKAAAVGLGSTKVVADAATSAINAYGSENLSAGEAVDVLTAAVREGKVQADRLAPAIGKAIPVASAMGIEFHEVAAAIASMTRTGTDARTSAIQLRQIMQSILDPSRQTTRALKEMGVAEGELIRQAEEEGLLAVLKRLRVLADENGDAFADVFPNIRALAGALDITGANLKENEEIFRQLEASVGDTDEAFKVTRETLENRMARATATLKVSFIELGKALVPLAELLAAIIEKMAGVVKWMADRGALTGLMMGVTVLTAALGLMLIVLGKIGMMVIFVTGALKAYTQSAITATVATGALSKAMMALPVIGTIALVASAIATIAFSMGLLGKETRTTSGKMADFRDSLNDVRMIGDRTVTSIMDVYSAVKMVADQSERAVTSRDFFSTFGDSINEALDNADIAGGGMFAENAFLKGMFGAGDSDAVYEGAIDIINDLQKRFGNEYPDLIARLFTGGLEGDDFRAFLAGDDRLANAERFYSLLAETQVQGIIDMSADVHAAWEEYKVGIPEDDRAAALKGTGGYQAFGEGDWWSSDALEQGMSDMANTFAEKMAKGDILDAALLRTTIMDDWDNATTMAVDKMIADGLITEADRAVWSRVIAGEIDEAWMMAVSQADSFLQDEGRALNLPSMFDQLLADPDREGKDFTEGGTSWGNYLLWAKEYEKVLNSLSAADIDEMGGLQFAKEWAVDEALVGVEKIQVAMEHAANSGEEGFGTVADVLAELEAAFEGADAAASHFNKTFDNLIGRTMELDDANVSFMDGQQDLADAVLEAGGSFDMYTDAGRRAREAVKDQVRGAQEMASAMLANGVDAEIAEAQFMSYLGSIEQTALANGATAAQITQLFAGLDLGPEDIALSFTTTTEAEHTDATETFANRVDDMVDGVLDLTAEKGFEIGEGLIEGVGEGIRGGGPVLNATAVAIMEDLLEVSMEALGISSPSKVFAISVGQPITTGIAEGILKEKGKLKNVIREVIDDALGSAKTQISTAMRAINAVLSFEEAERKLTRLRETVGGVGVDARHEKLRRAQLDRNLREAERERRLGKGHQEDLELAVMEAQFALEDFDTDAQAGTEIQKAEMDLAQAGFEVADAETAMRLEGQKAIDTFTTLGTSIGLTGESIQGLLGIRGDGTSIFESLVDADTRNAIAAFLRGEGWVDRQAADEEEVRGLSVMPIAGETGAQEIARHIVSGVLTDTNDPWAQGGMHGALAADFGPTYPGQGGQSANGAGRVTVTEINGAINVYGATDAPTSEMIKTGLQVAEEEGIRAFGSSVREDARNPRGRRSGDD